MRLVLIFLLSCVCVLGQIPILDSEPVKTPLFEDTFSVDYSYAIAPGAVELVTNGGFDSDTNGWTSGSSSITVVAGGQSGNCLELTCVSGASQFATTSFLTVIGQRYRFNTWIKSGSSGNQAFLLLVDSSTPVDILALSGITTASWVMFTGDFIATTSTSYIYLIKNTATAGTMLFDTVSCKLLSGVNNTLSTGRGAHQTRTVVDTAGKMKVEGGKLYLTGSTALNSAVIKYGSYQRTPGLTAISANSLTVYNSTGAFALGWDTTYTTPSEMCYESAGQLFIRQAISSVAYPSTLPVNTLIYNANSLRLNGAFYFSRLNNVWTMIYPYYLLTTTPVVLSVQQYNTDTNTLDSIRIPRTLWSPAPVLSDNFTATDGTAVGRISNGQGHPEANGGAGLVWQGGSGWQISGNKLINNPPLGAELLTDPGLEAWTTTNDLTSWVFESGTTQSNDVRVGSSGVSSALLASLATSVSFRQQITIASGSFYAESAYFKLISGSAAITLQYSPSIIYVTPTTSYTLFKTLVCAPSANGYVVVKNEPAYSSVLVDDMSVKQVAFTNLLLLAQLPTPNVIIEVKITAPSSQALAAGVALNFDSFSNPQNGTLVWLRNGNVAIQKLVAGTWTDIYDLPTSFTYSAGAKLMVVSDNVAGEIRIFYNNALITSRTDTQDAGIKNNRYFGLFSGNIDQQIDDVVIWARGTSGEYSQLDYLK